MKLTGWNGSDKNPDHSLTFTTSKVGQKHLWGPLAIFLLLRVFTFMNKFRKNVLSHFSNSNEDGATLRFHKRHRVQHFPVLVLSTEEKLP